MDAARDPRSARDSALTLGFATAVTMWAIAYVGRLPAVTAPSALIGGLMLAAVAGWGWFAGRRTGRWSSGAAGGAVAGVINLLILGSLVAGPDGALRSTTLWWLPASVVAVAALAGAAAALATAPPGAVVDTDWTAMLAKVAVAATFLLVVAGGLVTSNEAGLAVVDWPNTFGSNMFLYPISRMTGGIYYEHAHRLFGALVGLATLAVAFRLWRIDARSWVRALAAAAVVVVTVQGLLGGCASPGASRFRLPRRTWREHHLATLHGVLGLVFRAAMVGGAAATSRHWRSAPAPERVSAVAGDRTLQATLVGALVVQLVLGAIQRHLAQGLIIHITLAAFVTIMAIAVGARAWGLTRALAGAAARPAVDGPGLRPGRFDRGLAVTQAAPWSAIRLPLRSPSPRPSGGRRRFARARRAARRLTRRLPPTTPSDRRLKIEKKCVGRSETAERPRGGDRLRNPGPTVDPLPRASHSLDEELLAALDIGLGGAEVADRDAQRDAAVEPGVREKDLAGGVDAFEQAQVEAVEIGALEAAGFRAEADHRERHRRHPLEGRLAVDERGKALGKPDVGADPLADALEAEAAQHPPQLERPEAAPELDAIVHEVDRVCAATERRGQVLGDQREGAPEQLAVACRGPSSRSE
jgi:hypothetical protein